MLPWPAARRNPRPQDPSFRLHHRHQPASVLPITECMTLEMAQGTAVSGSAKFRRAKTTPNPEFCIPTSIETVRAARRSRNTSRAIR
jgi:hypothetical protein